MSAESSPIKAAKPDDPIESEEDFESQVRSVVTPTFNGCSD